ncbi:ribonuclease T2 family protein [Ferrimonas balearica]|uniref:ribonuclease T2 family protein n=1 Tax=Ferrimonas balearica TaxID=44012 RepID=UPI001C99D4EB|nr:hypothetical protein [Ferrimonas balearica]MBY5992909.1 hypothetical protein [Ferrimonas balearica]
MRALLGSLLFLVLLQPAWGQVPAEGQLLASQACEAFQSIRKQSNPGALSLVPGQAYPVLAQNKPGGDWFLVQVDGQRRWVATGCGEHQGGENATAAAPQPFAHYTLAMSWHSGFCAERGNRPDCRQARGELVLHGLWPSHPRAPHPEYCDGSRRQGFCRYSALALEPELRQQLDTLMPGTQVCLERYQWHKHGSCSGLSTEAYFQQSVTYSQWLKASSAAAELRRQAGGQISLAAALEAFERWGWGEAVSLHCRGGYLEEVRLYLQPDLPSDPSLARPAPFQGQQRCPARFDLLP